MQIVKKEKLEKLAQEYVELGHAVQSGIAACIGIGWDGTTPKHLRVGIDTSKSDQAALAKLLIEKGVITEVEYYEALVEGLKEEVEGYVRLYKLLAGTEAKISFH